MLDWIVGVYSNAKSAWSRFNNFVMGGAPRKPVKVFATPALAAEYLMANAKYTGDGPLDFNIDPERLEAAMQSGQWDGLHTDCDDYAAWAVASCSQIPMCRIQLYTIVDLGVKMTHVIAVGTFGGMPFAIDTNGFRMLPDLQESTIIRTWNEIYKANGAKYIKATPTPYPF